MIIDLANNTTINTRTVLVTVALEIKEDMDIADVINEMDYDFKHEGIVDMEITDIDVGD